MGFVFQKQLEVRPRRCEGGRVNPSSPGQERRYRKCLVDGLLRALPGVQSHRPEGCSGQSAAPQGAGAHVELLP